jgi:hypothetical protein
MGEGSLVKHVVTLAMGEMTFFITTLTKRQLLAKCHSAKCHYAECRGAQLCVKTHLHYGENRAKLVGFKEQKKCILKILTIA